MAYLRFAAPNWPPAEPLASLRGPEWRLLMATGVAVAGCLATSILCRLWARRNASGRNWGLARLLTGTAAATALSALGILLWSGDLPDPRAHALGATVAALVFYAALHVGIGGVIIVASVIRRALGARAGPLRGGAAGGRPPHRWLTGWAGRSATVAVQRPVENGPPGWRAVLALTRRG